MGWEFNLEHANIVAYLSVPPIYEMDAPRVSRDQMEGFLEVLGSDRESKRLMSRDIQWLDSITRAARELRTSFRDEINRESPNIFPADSIPPLLDKLRPFFQRFHLYSLAVGQYEDFKEIRDIAIRAAHSDIPGLFLIPDGGLGHQGLKILDPFPAISQLALYPDRWPGMLFWTRSGWTSFIGIKHVPKILAEIEKSPASLEDILSAQGNERDRNIRLLHISDLHFGTPYARRNQGYLLSHLRRYRKFVDQTIITGDLAENPKPEDMHDFEFFRSQLDAALEHDSIVVPGNHDQKWRGNVTGQLKELANLEWSNIVVNDKIQTVFLCFDSAIAVTIGARGRIKKEQLLAVGERFEREIAKNPRIEAYKRVAILHHHPFTFETGNETLIQRALGTLGFSDEYFLRMDDAEQFLDWCARRKVFLILHGHKHVQRHVVKSIGVQEGGQLIDREITTIGCGTSLGAENFPLSYNLLAHSADTRNWGVTFYSSAQDAGGFTPQAIVIQRL